MHPVPYEMSPIGGLSAPGGQASCFEIDFPGRAIISKMVVTQQSGTMVDFTFSLWSSIAACGGLSQSDSLGDDTGYLSPELYRVTPEIAGSAGVGNYFANTGDGYQFVNQDKGTSAARLGVARKVYLRITPGGTGAKTFAVCLGGLIN